MDLKYFTPENVASKNVCSRCPTKLVLYALVVAQTFDVDDAPLSGGSSLDELRR